MEEARSSITVINSLFARIMMSSARRDRQAAISSPICGSLKLRRMGKSKKPTALIPLVLRRSANIEQCELSPIRATRRASTQFEAIADRSHE